MHKLQIRFFLTMEVIPTDTVDRIFELLYSDF
nr:MAG TPA: hypothetical protein [Caudoviricetes sp.]